MVATVSSSPSSGCAVMPGLSAGGGSLFAEGCPARNASTAIRRRSSPRAAATVTAPSSPKATTPSGGTANGVEADRAWPTDADGGDDGTDDLPTPPDAVSV